jgi:hypothetical protein
MHRCQVKQSELQQEKEAEIAMASSSARDTLRTPGDSREDKRPVFVRRTSGRNPSLSRDKSPIQLPSTTSSSSKPLEPASVSSTSPTSSSSLQSPPASPSVRGVEGKSMKPDGGPPAYGRKAEDPQRRPLINYVTNEWRNSAKYKQSATGFERKDARYGLMIRSPKFRRYILVYAVLLLACWLGWKSWLQPKWEEEALLAKSLDDTHKIRKGWFGINARPPFADMIQVKDLDQTFLPTFGKDRTVDKNREKRLVIIGDVHGCKDERMFHGLLTLVYQLISSSRKTPG